MPKVPRTTLHTRTLPYPNASSSSTMAPHVISTAPLTSTRTTSPLPTSAVDRNAANTWNPEMDDALMRARQSGENWGPIASRYFPGKTANACRKRHERLMAQRNNSSDWDAAKMDALAKAYSDVRQEMWQILANRMQGEKWSTVEAKCMEKGLKTLQTSARTARRREGQANTVHGGSDYDEDFLPSFTREHPSSHANSEDGFADSAMGLDDRGSFHERSLDDPFAPNLFHSSPHSRPQQRQHQSHHQHHRQSTQPSPIARTPPPSFAPAHRTFSTSSTISSSLTPVMTSAPSFPSQYASSTRQSPSQTERERTMLPSFSSTFGMPSISNAIRPPVTTVV